MSACHMYSCEKEVHCLYSEYYHESVKINSEKKHREGNYRGTVSTAKVMNSRRLLKFPICNIFIELHLSSCLDFFIHDVA